MQVEVYGGNHSPWVQAVLLALHDKGIEHNLRQVPPLETLQKWGVLMPAISVNNGPWQIESSKILVELGYKQISDVDLQAVKGTWQGVLHRIDSPWQFFAAFARAGDSSPAAFKRTRRNFLRSFIPMYMFTLINVAKLKMKPKDPKNFGDQYLSWERAVASGDPFLDGEAPGARDLLLFGVVQCHSSIPVPPLISLANDQRLSGLRDWVGRMHEWFRDYPHLYSGEYFEPRLPQPVAQTSLQQGIFYIGLMTLLAAMPVTLALIFILIRRVPR